MSSTSLDDRPVFPLWYLPRLSYPDQVAGSVAATPSYVLRYPENRWRAQLMRHEASTPQFPQTFRDRDCLVRHEVSLKEERKCSFQTAIRCHFFVRRISTPHGKGTTGCCLADKGWG